MLDFFSIRYHPESENWGERRTEIPKNLIGDGCLCDRHQSVLYHCFIPDTHAESRAIILWLISIGF